MEPTTTIPEVTRDVAHDSLSDISHRFAYEQLPSRFHTAAQLALPLSYQLWTWGWHRSAGWLTALALFSLWALAEQHLTGHADSNPDAIARNSKGRSAWRVLRRVSVTAGSLVTIGLVLEAFAQIMSHAFKCPGCAG
jgi:hypothetical protein